ncbi:glycosyltransferase [Thermofilum sp.]|uniref:glycosyltransferase n=1 Tax=Thermofilum sp. TaxID=1961369 RepID=UPI003165A37E
MIRILLIPSSDYLGHPFPQRHNQIFERINDGKNFEVHVVRFHIYDKARLSSKCIIHDMPLEFKTESTPLYYLSNAVSHVREILRIIKQESIDLIVAGNLLPPFLLQLVKRILRMKIPFIFDLQDYYPTSAAGYICDLNSSFGIMVRGVFEWMTQTLLRSANVVTVPGIALAKYSRDVRGGGRQRQVYIVPNGISEHFLNKRDRCLLRGKLGYDEEDLILGYVGSIEFWLDMLTLIKALSKAYKQGLNVRFMLIGGKLQTAYAEKVMDWIKRYGIKHIVDYIGFVEHERVPDYIATMDIGVIPFDVRNPTAYYAAPNKLWEYLSQGVNVISTPIPEALAYKHLVDIVWSEEDYVATVKNTRKRMSVGKDYREIRRYIEMRTWNKSAECFKEIINSLVMHRR